MVEFNALRLKYSLFHAGILSISLFVLGYMVEIFTPPPAFHAPLHVGAPLLVGTVHALLIYTGVAPLDTPRSRRASNW